MLNQKQILREKIAKLRQSLSCETVAARSRIICDRLLQTDLFQKAQCIALYYATGNEVQTSALMECSGKKIVLPVISGENMYFYPYTGKDNLKKGAFGITEPIAGELISPEDIDLFVAPGIVFDFACNRIGRGKGYYDRYLSCLDKPTIGLGYDFQLVEHIPCEPHDKKMTMIITENVTITELSHHQ